MEEIAIDAFIPHSLGDRDRLIVSFNGEYRPGSAGNDDARFMHAATVAGVATTDASAVIFDFRALKYVWGDMLELVYDAAPTSHADKPGFAVVVGMDCKDAIRTLELGENSLEPLSSIPWVHESLDAAHRYLTRQ